MARKSSYLQVRLTPEGSVVASVAINEIIKDLICRPLVKALIGQQCGDGVSKLIDPVAAIFCEIAGDRPKQHGARNVVAIRPPLGQMPVPEPLLSHTLPDVTLLRTLPCHGVLPVSLMALSGSGDR